MTYIKFACDCKHTNYWHVKDGRITEFQCENCKKRIGYTCGNYIIWDIPRPSGDRWRALTNIEMEQLLTKTSIPTGSTTWWYYPGFTTSSASGYYR